MALSSKSKINFLVDAVGYFALMVLIGTGIIMAFILLPGRERVVGDPTSIMGLTRHDWGDVHFWASIAFLAAILLHIILHWSWIVSVLRTMIQGNPYPLLIVTFVVSILLIAFPFFTPWGYEDDEVERGGRGRSAMQEEPRVHDEESMSGGFFIRGRNTLMEIEAETGVNVERILEAMKLPSNTPRNERVGRLSQEYNFEIDTLRDVVSKLQQSNSPK